MMSYSGQIARDQPRSDSHRSAANGKHCPHASEAGGNIRPTERPQENQEGQQIGQLLRIVIGHANKQQQANAKRDKTPDEDITAEQAGGYAGNDLAGGQAVAGHGLSIRKNNSLSRGFFSARRK